MTAPDWTGYRVQVRQSAGWGPEAWKAEVTRKGTLQVPRMALDAPPADPNAFDLQDVEQEVGHAFAWSRAGAHKKADRLVDRDRRRRERWRNAEDRFIP